MMQIILSIIISFLMPFCICWYYASEQVENKKDIKHITTSLFHRTKKQYVVLALSIALCLLAFVIGHFIYKKADYFFIFRWQIAAGLLVPIAVIDLKERIIPNKLLLVGATFAILVIGAQILVSPEYFISILGNAFIGMLAGGGIFFLASLFVKNGIGAGDIKLFLLLGFLLAFRGIFNVLLYSMVISAVYAVVLLIMKKKTTKDELPLAPFALIGVLISILFGV